MHWWRNGCSTAAKEGVNMELKDKVIVITGGTSGIGYATALKMAAMGAKVIACARHEKNFEDKNIVYHQLDVTSTSSCEKLFNWVIENYGRVDCLVANAGITSDALTVKMADENFDLVINTNLKGVFNLGRLFGPYMEKQGYGSIVIISSVVGQQGNIGQANYAASKAGLIGMAKSWAKEFSRKGAAVRVNVVAPGYILTDMVKTVPQDLLDKFANQTMLKRLGEADEVANVISFLCSDESSYITGTVIDVNGGMRL